MNLKEREKFGKNAESGQEITEPRPNAASTCDSLKIFASWLFDFAKHCPLGQICHIHTHKTTLIQVLIGDDGLLIADIGHQT